MPRYTTLLASVIFLCHCLTKAIDISNGSATVSNESPLPLESQFVQSTHESLLPKLGYGMYYAGGSKYPYIAGKQSPNGIQPIKVPASRANHELPGYWGRGKVFRYHYLMEYNATTTIRTNCYCMNGYSCTCDIVKEYPQVYIDELAMKLPLISSLKNGGNEETYGRPILKNNTRIIYHGEDDSNDNDNDNYEDNSDQTDEHLFGDDSEDDDEKIETVQGAFRSNFSSSRPRPISRTVLKLAINASLETRPTSTSQACSNVYQQEIRSRMMLDLILALTILLAFT